LKFVKPDIVVLTGDIVSGYAWDRKSKDFYLSCWNQWSKVFEDNKVYYAYTFGNHDEEADLTREQIYNLDKTNPYSVMNRSFNITGLSNYHIPIYDSTGNTVVSRLWLLDTNMYGCENVTKGSGCIHNDQVEWYKKESQKVKEEQGPALGLTFFHIPIMEHLNVIQDGEIYGMAEEYVNCPVENTEVFTAFKQENEIKGVFVGHDHCNDFGGFYEGVEFVYGRKTGYGSYGPPDGVQKGGRVIEIELNLEKSNEASYSHYIIQEDLTIIENPKPAKRATKQQKCDDAYDDMKERKSFYDDKKIMFLE